MDTEMKREPLRIWQAAVAIGVLPQTVYNMLRDGRLTKLEVAGKMFVLPDELFDAMLEAKEAAK